MRTSFIGLGRMGSAMAGRLLAAGHDLTVFNRTASKTVALVKLGAKEAHSIADAARSADVVVTMLEHDEALSAVTTGADGLVQSMPHGAIHVAMGTHGIDAIRGLTEAHKKAGQVLIGAPVLGRPPAAAQGQIAIIVGGPLAAVKKCRPLFDAMARRTFDGGKRPVGAAAAKIANNLVLACAIEAMGEGFALAERCGVSGSVFLDLLTDGLFNCVAYKTYGLTIAEKAYSAPPGFTAIIGLKDVNLALAAGGACATPLPSASVCRDRLLGAISRGDGERDWTVMALEQARCSGMA